jgi:hypothetical protein
MRLKADGSLDLDWREVRRPSDHIAVQNGQLHHKLLKYHSF